MAPAGQESRMSPSPLSRREFVCSAGLSAAVLAAGQTAADVSAAQQSAKPAEVSQAPQSQPAALAHGAAGQPLVISSANGVPACNRAMELLRQGADPVDAVVAGVNLVEDDP